MNHTSAKLRTVFQIVALLAFAFNAPSTAVADSPGTFTAAVSMGAARYQHTATLLPNGKVLLVGGLGLNFNYLASAELYDPVTGTSTATGSMGTARYGHTATLLPNGQVLITGGYNGNVLASAELYDPATGTFTPTSVPMGTARLQHTATLLPNGKVLIGGYAYVAELFDPTTGTFMATGSMGTARQAHTATLLPNGQVLFAGGGSSASAELYNPATGTFTPTTGPMGAARSQHTATLLSNGQVLIAAGTVAGAPTFLAELYNPATGTFTATGALGTARYGHTATLLPNGQVLIAGGNNGAFFSSAELYNPATGAFTFPIGPMGTARSWHAATLLPNGQVLVTGGYNGIVLASAERYCPEMAGTAGIFSATGSLGTARYNPTATLLPNGKVLVTGGADTSNNALASAELYDLATGTFTPTGALSTARYNPTGTLLPNGKVLVTGGDNVNSSENSPLASAELYDPTTGTFTLIGAMGARRNLHTATLLPNGKVLIAGGTWSNPSAELYDPATGTFTATGSMGTNRWGHTATLLPNGKVLIAGGEAFASNNTLASAELYDPATGTFTATGSLATPRRSYTATLLPNGKVLIAGGYSDFGNYFALAELYDPATGTFAATGPMGIQRTFHTATLLPNGKVLIVGGHNGFVAVASAELYDPVTGTFAPTGSMGMARFFHTATLLPTGQILIAGGNSGSSILGSTELYATTICGWGIASISPTSGGIGTSVTITGSGFGATQGSSTVKVNGVTAATVTNWTNAQIIVNVPSGASSGPVVVTVNGVASNGLTFSVLPPPTISSVTPTSGVVGSTLTIAGTNLTGATGVTFSGTAPIGPTSVTATSLAVTVPAGATTGPISVTTPGGTAISTARFKVLPQITAFAPTSGGAGASVVITGTSFTGATGVKIGTIVATTVTVNSDTQITLTVPATAVSGMLSVTTPGGTATSATTFTVVKPLTLTSFTPTSGAVGTVVTLTGTNLSGVTGVAFNGVSAGAPTIVSATSIKATVPLGATTGPISVTNLAGTGQSAGVFKVLPKITGFTPTSGLRGDTVMITGTGFTGATAVKVGTVTVSPAFFTVNSDQQITLTVPPTAVTGLLSVTTAGGTATSATSFTVSLPPTVTSFTPASGAVGTVMTIAGNNLSSVTAVAFNGVSAGAPTIVSATSIKATVPLGATTGPISVTNLAGTAQSTSAFKVLPHITSFTPSGVAGASVTISGTNLMIGNATPTVKIGTVVVPVTSATPTQVVVTVPSTAVTATLSVTTADGTATSATQFGVIKVTSFTPTSGAVGATVTITGTNLSGATGVRFNGGSPVTPLVTPTATTVKAIVPAGATTGPISVVTPAGTATSANSFTTFYTLTVTKAGTNNGTVTSSPAGITKCSTTCSANYASGTVVTLTAVPATGAALAGWSGACSGVGTCTVTMSAAQNVSATFAPGVTLTVSKTGTGSGTVTSNPPGITCGATCASPYTIGTVVTLSAIPSTGFIFSNWNGACTGSGACTVTMGTAQQVTATFAVPTVAPVSLPVTQAQPFQIINLGDASLGQNTTVTVRFFNAAGYSVSTPQFSLNPLQIVTPVYVDPTTGQLAAGVVSIELDYPDGTKRPASSALTIAAPPQLTKPPGTVTLAYLEDSRGVVDAANANLNSLTGTLAFADVQALQSLFTQSSQQMLTLQNQVASVSRGGATIGLGALVTPTQRIPVQISVDSLTALDRILLAYLNQFAPSTTARKNKSRAHVYLASFREARAHLAAFAIPVQQDGGCPTIRSLSKEIGSTSQQIGVVASAIGFATVNIPLLTAGFIVTTVGTIGAPTIAAGVVYGCEVIQNLDQKLDQITQAVQDWNYEDFNLNNLLQNGRQLWATAKRTLSPPRKLSVTVGGPGSGTLSTLDGAISNCAAICGALFDNGATVTIFAINASGSTFNGWSGCTPVPGAPESCTVTMSQDQDVIARFALQTFALTVNKAGTGSGTVTCAGTGVAADCSGAIPYNTSVTLTATPASGSTFSGWSGACTNATGTCTVTMTQDQTVTATFDQGSGSSPRVTNFSCDATTIKGGKWLGPYPSGAWCTVTLSSLPGQSFSGVPVKSSNYSVIGVSGTMGRQYFSVNGGTVEGSFEVAPAESWPVPGIATITVGDPTMGTASVTITVVCPFVPISPGSSINQNVCPADLNVGTHP